MFQKIESAWHSNKIKVAHIFKLGELQRAQVPFQKYIQQYLVKLMDSKVKDTVITQSL